MSAAPVCFLQSGDFRLDSPLSGLDHLPDALRQVVIEAPYLAAARVFDAALAERVEFVVLTGSLCNLHAPDPRAVSFLSEQFTRLTDSGIELYIAGGPADPPELWPAALALPEGMHWFSTEVVDTFHYRRGGEPLAALCGRSLSRGKLKPAEFERPDDAPLALAVVHGEAKPAKLAACKFDYWALGGRALAGTPAQSPATIHFAGAPQGLSPAEAGAGGCTVVRLDAVAGARQQRVETDVVRYHQLSVTSEPGSSRDDLEMLLFERFAELADTSPGRHLLVSVDVAAGDELSAALHAGTLIDQILADLREEFGGREPAVWPVDINIDVAASDRYPSGGREEESVLGEYLRTMHDWAEGNGEDPPCDLAALVPGEDAWATLAELNLTQSARQQALLGQATALGASLLSGDHTES